MLPYPPLQAPSENKILDTINHTELAMHYLIMPLGSAGDVHPFVGLALELKRRGHSVTLSTNGYFAGLAKRFGLDFIELGSEAEFHAGIQSPELWHPFRSFPYLYRKMIEPTVRPQFEIVAQESAKRPTTVLSNCFGFGALNAHRRAIIQLAVALEFKVIDRDVGVRHPWRQVRACQTLQENRRG